MGKILNIEEGEIVVYRARDNGEQPYIVLETGIVNSKGQNEIKIQRIGNSGKPSGKPFTTTLWDLGMDRQRIFKLWVQTGDKVRVHETNSTGEIISISAEKISRTEAKVYIEIEDTQSRYLQYTLSELSTKIELLGD